MTVRLTGVVVASDRVALPTARTALAQQRISQQEITWKSRRAEGSAGPSWTLDGSDRPRHNPIVMKPGWRSTQVAATIPVCIRRA